MGLIAQGANSAEIARELVISPKAVSNHTVNILSKLQLADCVQATVEACQAGLGSAPE